MTKKQEHDGNDISAETARETLNALINSRAQFLGDDELTELVQGLREQRRQWVENQQAGNKKLAPSHKIHTNLPAGHLVKIRATDDNDLLDGEL